MSIPRSNPNRNPAGCKGTHHLSNTPEYRSWVEMRRRCESEDVSRTNYRSKGVTVCERWRDFTAFLEDMGPKPSPKHTIDRKDNSGNYEPTNCRWATSAEQNLNRSSIHWITYRGETHCISEWADILGIKRVTLMARIVRYGWAVERAFTAPVGPQGSHRNTSSKQPSNRS